MKGIE